MLHESEVLKIIPQDSQPAKDIKCRGCIHGNWRSYRTRNIQEAKTTQELDVYCTKYFAVMYHSAEPMPEVLECDGFSDEIKEDEN